jgi:aminoglycoside phosphotransferase (APT) family kinase protein
MIDLVDEHSIHKYLLHIGFASSDSPPEVNKIPGGVSNHVWKVRGRERCFVVKQPLEKLATADDWYSGVERIDTEVAALRTLAMWAPGHIPDVLFFDQDSHVCIMSCAPDPGVSWKEEMMGGKFDGSTALAAGKLLAGIHRQSASAEQPLIEAFSSLRFLEELRLDPFHRFVAKKHPELGTAIDRLVDELVSRPTCFVHGDFSPKNLLLGKDRGLTLIDCEVAHWGNPVFDVAFCLGHLMLKGWALGHQIEAVESVSAFLDGYGEPPEGLIRHLALMLLARIDGKSTIDYLTSPVLESGIRSVCKIWIHYDDRRNPQELMTTALLGGSKT